MASTRNPDNSLVGYYKRLIIIDTIAQFRQDFNVLTT